MSTVETAVGRFVWHDHMSGDPAAAHSFYSELLGWEIEVWKPGEMDYPMIKVGEAQHGGFGPAQGGAPAHWLGHVAVGDVDDAAARAESAGGRIVAPAMDIPDVGRMVVVADPQGAVLSLFTPADASWTPAEGVFVWDELMTTDVEGAKAFYGEVVGWESRDMDMGNGVITRSSQRAAPTAPGACRSRRRPKACPPPGSRTSESRTSTPRWRRPRASARPWSSWSRRTS